MNLQIRSATETDAARVVELYHEFTEYLRALGDAPDARLTPELFRRDGFGPTPAFHTLVAERDGVVIGYLLYHFGYDAELAARAMHIVDLYATRHHRGQGAGSALMTSARAICCADAIPRMVWSDYKPNRLRACSMNAWGQKSPTTSTACTSRSTRACSHYCARLPGINQTSYECQQATRQNRPRNRFDA